MIPRLEVPFFECACVRVGVFLNSINSMHNMGRGGACGCMPTALMLQLPQAAFFQVVPRLGRFLFVLGAIVSWFTTCMKRCVPRPACLACALVPVVFSSCFSGLSLGGQSYVDCSCCALAALFIFAVSFSA